MPYSLADCLAHIDHITSAVLSAYCGKVYQITAICCRQRNLREIGTRSAAGKEKGSKLLETSAPTFGSNRIRTTSSVSNMGLIVFQTEPNRTSSIKSRGMRSV